MQVDVLPLLEDNFTYVLRAGGEAAVVDPADGAAVLRHMEALTCRVGLVLLTHHHTDHTAGCAAVTERFGCPVAGPRDRRLPMVTQAVADGDRVELPWGDALDVIGTPGHTLTGVCYHDAAGGALWSGDTLFAAGCGRLLEGSPGQIWQSLLRLRALPPDTRVYCGHEYTVGNLEFALSLMPGDAALARRLESVRAGLARGRPSVPSTLREEAQTNIFLRSDTPAVQEMLGLPERLPPEAVFAELRGRKDRW